MLFLAVFLGFLAENEREHMIEHKREKQYIRTLISDIKTDTTNIQFVIKDYQLRAAHADTALNLFDNLWSNDSSAFFAFSITFNSCWVSKIFILPTERCSN